MNIMGDRDEQEIDPDLRGAKKRNLDEFACTNLSQGNEANVEPSDAPRASKRKLP